MEIEQLKQLLALSWNYETCSPGLKNKWSKDNPSLGQCAITSLIVNDFFGGKIMRCMTTTGSHYYNLIDEKIVDLTREQFLDEIPQYDNSSERTREYLLSNEDTRERYLLLLKNIQGEIEKGKINIKIYIDFDGTLFDTDKYTNDFMNIFKQYGINSLVFDSVKTKLFNNESLFDLYKIIDYVVEKYNIDIEIKKLIANLLNNSYVYPEVSYCLNELINYGYELCLLTYGDREFQNMKINSTGIGKYFNEIIITNKEKSELNLDYKNSIFIDNNPVVIENLFNSNAKRLIRIKRESDRYTREKSTIDGIIECSDFNQVVLHLKGGFNNE